MTRVRQEQMDAILGAGWESWVEPQEREQGDGERELVLTGATETANNLR
jgi:hypothetical protein